MKKWSLQKDGPPLLSAAFKIVIIFLSAVAVSSIKVIKNIFLPIEQLRSKEIDLELGGFHPRCRILIAHLISLTPGTYAIDLPSESPMKIRVHLLDATQEVYFRNWISHKLEPEVAKLFGVKK